jgi:hypothetical protein
MTNRTATTAAIIFSLAAAGAPAASARPIDFVSAGQHSPAAVYSRPDKSTIPASPPATSDGAVSRAVPLPSVARQERRSVAGLSAYREGQLAASLDVAATAGDQASARVHSPQTGFDWGDAGLGAAGGLVLSVSAVGGMFALSGRRSRRSTAVPS